METEAEAGLPVDAGLTAARLTPQLVFAVAVPALTVMVAGDGVVLPAAKDTLWALSEQPPEMEMLAFTAPSVPPVRVTEKLVEPVETGMLGSEAVLSARVPALPIPIDWVAGTPVWAGLTAVRVTTQLPPAAAEPALTVTVAGEGVELTSAKDTLEALSEQPPETARLAVTAPEVPPERATAIVVEPVEGRMLAAVPEALSARMLAGAVTAAVKVLGVPRGAVDAGRRVTTQLLPTGAAPALKVTVAGTGDAVPSRKATE